MQALVRCPTSIVTNMAMVNCDVHMFNIEMYTYQIKVPWVGGNVQLTHCQHSVFMQSRTSNPMQPIITCE